MKKYTSKVTAKSIIQSGLPTDYKKAVAEFIWNSFDAKATKVSLDFEGNKLGYLSSFSIGDNGTGIDIQNLDNSFGNFLDSQKRDPFNQQAFQKGRKGKGRYAFSMFAQTCSWSTTFIGPEEKKMRYKIVIDKGDIQNYNVEDTKIIKSAETGTIVSFTNIFNLSANSLLAKDFDTFLCGEFGWFLFLNKNKGLKIVINGIDLDYQKIIGDSQELTLEFGDDIFNVVFLRWNQKIGDKYFFYFLSQHHKEAIKRHTLLNNNAIDFHHSVYIESAFFNEFNEAIAENLSFDIFGKNQSHLSFKSLLKSLDALVREKEKQYIKDIQAHRLIKDYRDKGILPDEKVRSPELEPVLKEIYCAEPRVFQTSNIQQSKMVVGLLNLLLATNQNAHIVDLIEGIFELKKEEEENIRKV